MSLGNRRVNPFSQPIARGASKGPEYNPWFWNPNRVGVKVAPPWFRVRLREIAESLEVTWNPITERWQVWNRADKIQNKICSGWRLLFVHHLDGEYLPLDERLFARLHLIDTKNSCARDYFNRVQAELEREKARKDAQISQDAIDQAMPYWDHSRIKVGYGPSNGSKFSTYHS